MGYNECIEAAGEPVLSYLETGSYQGTWYAYTSRGFYTGSYGSCSGCDWRESEQTWDANADKAKQIDAGIGRKILEDAPMDLEGFLVYLTKNCYEDLAEVEAWARKAVEI